MAQDLPASGCADFLHVHIAEAADGLIIALLDGELCHGTGAPALELFTDAIGKGETRILLDLSKLGFCDSTGLRLLSQLHERAQAAGGWLRLAGPSPAMVELLALTRLDQVIPVYSCVEEATDR